jgi:hypothetical protein
MLRAFLLQTYDREMGDGVVVTLKGIDVPIRVHGRRWACCCWLIAPERASIMQLVNLRTLRNE